MSRSIIDTFHEKATRDITEVQKELDTLLMHYYNRACDASNTCRIPAVAIRLEATGRPSSGLEVKWEVTLDNTYFANSVEHSSLEEAFNEALRRRGFNEKAQTKRITHSGEAK